MRKLAFLGAPTLVAAGVVVFFVFKGPAAIQVVYSQNGNGKAVIPVNTVFPVRKTLLRTLEQPASIKPWAQAELYAKASGNLRTIQRQLSARNVADMVLQGAMAECTALASAGRMAAGAHAVWHQAPQKDIGSIVHRGELLMEIHTPERTQEIVEAESKVRQREAELEAARAALATFESAVQVAKAQKAQAQADMRRYASEYNFRKKELARLEELVKSKTITQELADEKDNQVNAALAAWESSQAKVQTADAEATVISSKFAAAQVDLKVKEALVQVAKDELRLANLIADYSRVYAPFDGVITQRGVDEGDFVQNASSGQSRKLMTVTALDKVKAVIQTPEGEAPWVQVGTEVVLNIEGRNTRQVVGRVSRIAHALDSQTRTMQVEIDLDNPDRALLPGMYGKARLTLVRIPNAQAVPATAVYSRKGENFILVVQNGAAHRQQVRIRYDDGKEMEVVKLLAGKEVPLDGGDELIISNKGELADGQKVKATPLNRAPNPKAASKGTDGHAHSHLRQPLRRPDDRGVVVCAGRLSPWLPGGPAGRHTARPADRL